ncbi:branched-chain amino acid ABC transporter permease [Rhodobacterales bacterium HKCCE2091]|nr:branched-chain amino acid ABC transporter permease [Rhodobacterales bacterium HKCCE2091]
MTTATAKSTYFRGVRNGLPFLLVVMPFGMLFGVVATEAGLNLAQVMGFSFLVIAGAAQFTALQLMVDNAPALIVIASALAVNLRMAMYSASLQPHLGAAPLWQRALIAYFNVDQSYALAIQDYDAHPERPLNLKVAYFFGVLTPVCPLWYVATLIGALVGTAIPEEFALDFAVPITFIALIAPALRTFAHVAAAVVAVVLAIVFAFLPYNLWLFVAGAGGMMVGAEIERRRAS